MLKTPFNGCCNPLPANSWFFSDRQAVAGLNKLIDRNVLVPPGCARYSALRRSSREFAAYQRNGTHFEQVKRWTPNAPIFCPGLHLSQTDLLFKLEFVGSWRPARVSMDPAGSSCRWKIYRTAVHQCGRQYRRYLQPAGVVQD